MHRSVLATVLLLGTSSLTLLAPLSAAPATGEAKEARCAKLKGRIDEVRLKLRLGYTAKQGRVYRQKLTALESELRAERCR